MLDLDTEPEATAPGAGERPGDALATMAALASCLSGRERNYFQRTALGVNG